MRDLVAPECREGFDRYLERIKSTGADQGTLCVVYGSCTRTAPAARFDSKGRGCEISVLSILLGGYISGGLRADGRVEAQLRCDY